MSPAPTIESTQVISQAVPQVPRFERVALLIALTGFLITSAIGLLLYLLKFQVENRVVNLVLVIVGAVAITGFFRITPASKLTPLERMIRHRRLVYGLIGTLTGAALLGSIATASELDTFQDWAMLAFIASAPVGIAVLVNVRFSIG